MADIILDSSAILAWIGEEPGHETITPYLADAACSANIIAEVVTKLADWGTPTDEIRQILLDFAFEVHPVDLDTALEIGLLYLFTRQAGLSLGNRSCLSLARRLDLPVVTTDRAWGKVADSIHVEVRLVR